jgi:hypothetical protein
MIPNGINIIILQGTLLLAIPSKTALLAINLAAASLKRSAAL